MCSIILDVVEIFNIFNTFFFKKIPVVRTLDAEAERRQILLLCSKLGDVSEVPSVIYVRQTNGSGECGQRYALNVRTLTFFC